MNSLKKILFESTGPDTWSTKYRKDFDELLIRLKQSYSLDFTSLENIEQQEFDILIIDQHIDINSISIDKWILYVSDVEVDNTAYALEKLFIIPTKQISQIFDTIEFIVKSELNVKIEQIESEIFIRSKKIYEGVYSYLDENFSKKNNNYDEQLLVQDKLNSLKLQTIECTSFLEIQDLINKYLDGLNIDLEIITINRIEKMLNNSMNTKDVFSLPVEGVDGIYYCCFRTSKPIDYKSLSYFVASELVQIIESRVLHFERIGAIQSLGAIWLEAFNSIPVPVALFDNNDDLLFHNFSFAEINILPKECLKLIDGQMVKKDKSYYLVDRTDLFHLEERLILYTFVASLDNQEYSLGTGEMTSQELGIVSSSIAHELNNPIAGILAALSFIQLDSNLDELDEVALKEMKEGVIRCRDLVKVFLGFSRVNPDLEKKEGENLARKSFAQAVDLLRFRMVESGMRLNVEYLTYGTLDSGRINKSVMAMMFYLLLGEVMTHSLHQELVQLSQRNKNINIIYHEYSDKISLKISPKISSVMIYSDSMLFKHLCDMLEMSISLDDSMITLNFERGIEAVRLI